MDHDAPQQSGLTGLRQRARRAHDVVSRPRRPSISTTLAPVVVVSALGLVAGCGESDDEPQFEPDTRPAYEPGVVPLAKAEGSRAGPGFDPPADFPHGLIEIAYDTETAESAWADNVPDAGTVTEFSQGAPGVYGSLDDVDFDEQALVVWHGGESGSCPGWLRSIQSESGRVTLESGVAGPSDANCTSDYNYYRMVLAVDLDLLPTLDELPTEDVTIDGWSEPDVGRVSAYPDEELPRH